MMQSVESVWPLEAPQTAPTLPSASARFATTNPGKLAEIAQFLGVSLENIEGVAVELPELHPSERMFALMRDGKYEACTEAIAAQKARDAFAIEGRDVTVEDSGLYLHALKGLPGPCIKDWCTPEGLQALCAACSEDRSATFVVTFAYYSGEGEPQLRSAKIRGRIADTPRGSNGFGFDSIFIPEPTEQVRLWRDRAIRTYAEMTAEEKQQLSPRRLALQAMADQPFTGPSEPPSVRLPASALAVVSRDFKQPIPDEHRATVEAACLSHVRERVSRIREEMKTSAGRRQLVWEGELPERVLDNEAPLVRRFMREFDMNRLRVFTAESAACVLANGVMRMELINHPLRLETQLRLQQQGFVPVRGKSADVMDHFAQIHTATTFDDLKLGYEGGLADRVNLERIIGIMVQGLWTWSSTKLTTGFTVGSSVPAMNSAFALAEGALCGNLMFAPVDSYWTNPAAQDAMLAMAHRFIDQHPFFAAGRFNEVRLSSGQTVAERVRERAHRLIGATLKARELEIAERTEQLLGLGTSVFRPYEAGVTRTLQASVRAMTAAHRGVDMAVYAGQVGSVEQARECVEAGAHALIVGIGDGDLCTTADVAAIAADNPQLVYQLVRANLGVPVGADGGVGSRAPVAAALGASFRIRAGALVGGTLSLRLVKMISPDSNGTIFDATAGEASALTKLRAGQVDALGEPMNVEGTAAREPFEPNSPTIARRIWDGDMAGPAKAIRFSGGGRDSLLALIHAHDPNIRGLTPNAMRKGSSHPGTQERFDVPVFLSPEFESLLQQDSED